MAFTPLHRALGLSPSPLEYSMLTSAIEQQLTEKGDLDWKKQLPENRHPKASEEFAKDVAAMVNAGGGMIVYGIAENGESSAAESIVPVDSWTDSLERKLRGWAYSLIQPPVHGLTFTPLSGDDNQVVVLEIPLSQETPHFAMKDDALRAPRRYGAQTVFMSERDIEQAYRARFADRRNNDRNMSDLLDQALLGVEQSGVWLTAAAKPINPRPGYAGRITEMEAKEILMDLMSNNPFFEERKGLETAGLNPRPGYRKWRSAETANGQTCSVVDIHDDGSVALAHEASRSTTPDDFDPSSDVHVLDAQALSAHIVHLARVVAERMGIAGDFEVCLTLSPPESKPIYIRTFNMGFSGLTSRDRLVPIHKFQPVIARVAANDPTNESLTAVRGLALDVVNQGGTTALGWLVLKDQI
ncbi:ATP-binding protein [Arthrobacter sp. 1P04PC]|uniref:AlbA family DNA-binding domain-containing protein n=1 Tax=unclassified Arthrobacter TaxID=235627 RepID=UPI0039A3B829